MCTPTYADFDDAACASSGTMTVNGACYNGDNTGMTFCDDFFACVPTADQFQEWVSFVATQPYVQLDITGAASTPSITLMTYSTDCPATDNTTCPGGGGSACIFSGNCVTATTGTFSNLVVGRTYYAIISTATQGTYQVCATADHCINGIQDADETGNDCGGADCAACGGAPDYTHGTAGINSSRVTHCMVNTCNGTYTDDGGGGGSYSLAPSNYVGYYRVFCPDAYGQCMRATITQWDIQTAFMGGCNDYLQFGNGATQNSASIWAGCGTLGAEETVNGTFSNPIVADNTSGCLSFRFFNTTTANRPGWSIDLDCVPCATAGNGPQSADGSDCTDGSTQICGEAAAVTAVSAGPGIASDGCAGCTSAGGETYSLWYYFDVSASGTMEFLVTSSNGTDDYDFALYEATDCGSLGAPVRCSYAATVGAGGTTGLQTGAGDNDEDVTGDAFVDPIAVTAGQRYYLMVNEWGGATGATGAGFDLDFTFSAGASINCIPPVLELTVLEFDAFNNGSENVIEWVALTDENVTSFIIEKSYDGKNFTELRKVKTSPEGGKTFYNEFDDATIGTVYYRLKQISTNKKVEYSEIKKVTTSNLNVRVNPNVFNEQMFINIDAKENSNLKIAITNLQGQTVIEDIVNIEGGDNNNISINTSGFAKGVYFLRIEDLSYNTTLSPIKVIKE